MKKHYSFILCLFALALLSVGCRFDKKKACKVGYNYAYAMANYQVEEAEKYATDETKNTTLVMAKFMVNAVGEDYIKSDTPAKVEIVKYSRLDDSSAVIEFHKTTPIKDSNFPLLMRKRNGQWMAHDTIPVRQEEPQMPDTSSSIARELPVNL